MRKIELTEATEPLAEYVKQIEGEAIVITYKGVALAALVPLDNVDYESVALGENPKFMEIIERSRQSIREGKGIPADEMRREFEQGT